jgi:hypothetical protein
MFFFVLPFCLKIYLLKNLLIIAVATDATKVNQVLRIKKSRGHFVVFCRFLPFLVEFGLFVVFCRKW